MVFFILVGMLLLLLPNFVIPQVATLNPAIHSKTLMLRWLLAAMGIAYFLAMPLRCRAPLSFVEAGIIGFVFANLCSSLLSTTPVFSLSDSWQLWALPLVSVGIYRLGPTASMVDRLFKLSIGGGIIAALYGFSVYWGYDFLREYYPFAYSKGDARNYIHSFLGNPEYFGGYIAALSVVCLGYGLLDARKIFARVGWFLCCFYFLCAVVLSGTRGALLGMAVGGMLNFYSFYRCQSMHVKRRMLFVGLVLVAFTATLVTIFSVPNPLNVRRMRVAQRFLRTFDLSSDSVRERILFFSVASRMVRDNPVWGVGPGCFKLHFYPTVQKLVEEDERAGFRHFAETLQGRVAEHAHNDYLELLSETGVVGFGVFVFIVSSLIMMFWRERSLLRCADSSAADWRPEAGYEIIAFCSLSCLLFNALFSFPLHLPVRASLFWVLVGLFMACSERRQGF
ncbi:MAG: O-antigen ligase family protein [Candidatus Sumerlaeaceae bacterium]|nr:O-antigen ligase family protein [Candidatus Sumerlaeaceae bacterium]